MTYIDIKEDDGGGPTNTTGSEVSQKEQPMTKGVQRRKTYNEFIKDVKKDATKE